MVVSQRRRDPSSTERPKHDECYRALRHHRRCRTGRLRQSLRATQDQTGDAAELLRDYPWPNNAAQLAGVINKAATLCEGGQIRPEHLPDLAA